MSSDYEDDPQDARFAFRRKANVQYLAPKKADEIMEIDALDDLPDFNLFVPNSKESRFRYKILDFEILDSDLEIFNALYSQFWRFFVV